MGPGGPLSRGEKEAASRHSVNIEFLSAKKVLAQLSTEYKGLSTEYKELSTEYREPSAEYKEPRAGYEVQRAGHEGQTDAEIIEVALAAKKVFIHRRM